MIGETGYAKMKSRSRKSRAKQIKEWLILLIFSSIFAVALYYAIVVTNNVAR